MKKIVWLACFIPLLGSAQSASPSRGVGAGDLMGTPLTTPYSEKPVTPPLPPQDPPDTPTPPPANPEERARLMKPYIEKTQVFMGLRKPEFRFVNQIYAQTAPHPVELENLEAVIVLQHDKWDLTCFGTSGRPGTGAGVTIQTCIPTNLLPKAAREEVRRK